MHTSKFSEYKKLITVWAEAFPAHSRQITFTNKTFIADTVA
jgi:hypothetical protein